MVDMVASNLKLEQRSRNMLRRLSPKCSSMSDSELDALLAQSKGSVKLAMLVAETGETVEVCQQHLDSAGGVLAGALDRACLSTQPLSPNTILSRRFTLCIDGGGTKCAAAIADGSGSISHGIAGACNLYVFVFFFFSYRGRVWTNRAARTDGIGNVPGVVATLIDATKSALKEHLPSGTEFSDAEWKQYLRSCFSSVWVGLAGLDRAGLHQTLAPTLAGIFGLDYTTPSFRLTSDVDLLPASVSVDKNPSSVLVLIAGTGSVAMRYAWTAGSGYVRMARSGGWGHMLGDEGGGYSIGLETIKHTLLVLEEQTLRLRPEVLGKFEYAVIKQLGCAASKDGSIDILSDLLSEHHQETVKTRIAQMAETVLELASHDEVAKAIVEGQTSHLVTKTLGRLTDPKSIDYAAPHGTVLVLAGGLMRNEGYQRALREQLDQRGLHFQEVHVVDDVAAAGAMFLLKSEEVDKSMRGNHRDNVIIRHDNSKST
jgi:N-acetylmuramic acid 6-phosphate etherase